MDVGQQADEKRPMPRLVFIVQVLYLAALLFVFALYATWTSFADALPEDLGPLPIGVPWFGATGGVLISLTGIFKHNLEWEAQYTYRHYTRPLVGAVVGSMGALIFFVVVEAASAQDGRTNDSVYNVVAFLLGYREETFRELIKRATDLLLNPTRESGRPNDRGE